MSEVDGVVSVAGSLAKIKYGDNNRLLPPEEVVAAVAMLVDCADVHVSSWEVDQWEVVYAELGMDVVGFTEETVSLWATSYADLPRSALYVHAIRRGQDPTPSTVMVGTKKGWNLNTYRKDKQRYGLPPTVRIEARLTEARLRNAWANKHGGCVVRVADLDRERVARLHHATCAAAGALETFTRNDNAHEVIARADGLTVARKYTLLGHLDAVSRGLPIDPPHRNTVRGIERDLRSLGLYPFLTADAPMGTRSARLDLEHGFVCEREKECDFGLVRGTPPVG